MAEPRRSPPDRGQQGLAVRRIAVEIVSDALAGKRTLDAALGTGHGHGALAALSDRDRGMVKALATETVRRHGQIADALLRFVDRMPKRSGRLETILAVGACQILFLDTAPHAAVDLAVRLAAADRDARHFKGLVNAVLRRVADAREAILAGQDAAVLNAPEWLARRWEAAYGADTARAIMAAHLEPAPLDLTVRDDPAGWAERLGGTVLATASVRLPKAGDVARLDGFSDGTWWVQDAAAALPARLLGDVAGLEVADLCAAPGGKTAQLAAAGAKVVAVERSASRLKRLKGNLDRLGLTVQLVEADAASWRPDRLLDAVLLDAPCTATGTLRRHPDIAWVRGEDDIAALAEIQSDLLDSALDMVRPGGLVVYATCSLEPEEGEARMARVLSGERVDRVPVDPREVGGLADCVTADGDLRTLPCRSPGSPGGMDGFFAARLRRR